MRTTTLQEGFKIAKDELINNVEDELNSEWMIKVLKRER